MATPGWVETGRSVANLLGGRKCAGVDAFVARGRLGAVAQVAYDRCMHSTLTWEEPWGLHVKISGVLTPEAFFALSRTVTQDARYNDLRYAIINYEDVERHTFDLADMPGIANSNALLLGAATTNPGIIGVIVGRPDILGLTRAMEAYARLPWRVGYFETELQALDWLSTQSMVFRQRPRPGEL